MRRRTKVVLAAASVVIVLATTGGIGVATGRLPVTGALSFDDGDEEWCSFYPGRTEATIGKPLTYPDGGPITITEVRAIDATEMRLVSAEVVPVTPELGVGFEGYPPRSAIDNRLWSERVPAAGARIQAGELRHLVLRVERRAGAQASIADFALTYRQGWRHFTVPLHTRVSFHPTCDDEDDTGA